jgi:GNAT superfamily N-acetyltransferase
MLLMPEWTIEPGSVADNGIEEAIWEYATEVSRRVWGRPVTEAELRRAIDSDPHSDLKPPHGMFLVARAGNGELLGYVGVRLLVDTSTTAEIKRMYVRPAGRGMGLGRGLLLAAEASARGLGAVRMVLETNTQLTEARAMYERYGYTETAPYHEPAAAEHWYVKELLNVSS